MKRVVRIDVVLRRLEAVGITYCILGGVVFRDHHQRDESGKRMHAKTIDEAVAAEAWQVLKGGERLADRWRDYNGYDTN